MYKKILTKSIIMSIIINRVIFVFLQKIGYTVNSAVLINLKKIKRHIRHSTQCVSYG